MQSHRSPMRTMLNLIGAQRNGQAWYRLENKASPKAKLYIYDDIGLYGVSAQEFIRDLQDVTADEIDLHISSYGGEVFDGIAIMESLKNHPAKVNVFIDSIAASIASVIAMGGDHITIGRNAQMMIHDGSGLCVGNASDMRQLADLLDKTSDNIASVYADRAGGSVSHWRGLMRAETWFSAQEAVDAGLADELAPVKENETKGTPVDYAGSAGTTAPAFNKSDVETDFKFDPELFRSAVRRAVS